jgi:tetratricopeptide (TPR) repeat protein
VNLSLAASYAAGGLHPAGYRLVNLFLHIVCALLLAAVVRRSTGDSCLAGASALAWMVHPLASEPVAYITARTESLMVVFVLLTLYASIRAWEPAARARWSVLAVAACAAAMLSKETAVVAPILVLLYDRLVRGAGWRDIGRSRWLLYGGLAAAWLVLAAVLVRAPRAGSVGFSPDPGLVGAVTPWTYLLNQAPMIVRYLRLAVWPVGLVFDYGPPRPIRLADVWPHALLVIALAGAAVAWLRRRPGIAFLGLWFFVTLAPVSTLVPIHTEAGAERRMYLPLMAFVVLAALAARAAWVRVAGPAHRRLALASAALVCVALAVLTVVRNSEYSSPLALWQTVVDRYPHGRARYNLSVALKAAGREDDAMTMLRASTVDYPEARSVLGFALLDRGDVDEGVRQLRTFLRERPGQYNAVLAHGRLGDAYFARQRYSDAIAEYREYLSRRGDQPSAWTNFGIALAADGQPAEAARAFARAAALEPASAAAHRNLANALLESGDADAALDEASRAEQLAPGDPVVREIIGLARARRQAGQANPHAGHERPAPAGSALLSVAKRPIGLKDGIGSAHDATGTSSTQAQTYYDQGLAFLHSYWWLEAARSFNQALALDPKLAIAHAALSVAYIELNAPAAARDALAQARALAPAASAHDRTHVELRALQMAAEEAGRWPEPGGLAAFRAAIDRALTAFPQDEELWLLRGLAESPDPAERGQGSVAASAAFYAKARTLGPAHVAAPHYLTHVYENTGRVAEALGAGATYAKMAPNVPHARHMHGHNLRRVGRVDEAIAEFLAADALETAYFTAERIPVEYDWHYQHNIDLLAASYQYIGQMKRAEARFRASFAIPSSLLQQEFNKRAWPVFLLARGRNREALDAAAIMAGHTSPIVSATGHVMMGEARLALGEFQAAADEANTALRLMRGSPMGAGIVANALQQLQGEFLLRTGPREKGRPMLEDLAKKVRAAPGPDAWTQALFTLESIARTARDVGDWELAAWAANQMIEHDPNYAGSQYALALAAEHQGDRARAAAAMALAKQYWNRADPDAALR